MDQNFRRVSELRQAVVGERDGAVSRTFLAETYPAAIWVAVQSTARSAPRSMTNSRRQGSGGCHWCPVLS